MNSICKIVAALVAVGVLAVGGYFVFENYFKTKTATGPTVEIGTTPARAATPVPEVKFTHATDAAGIRFKHFSGATGSKLLPETMGSGVAVIDFDNDGRPDLLFVNSCPWPGHPQPDEAPTLTLYRNKGDGAFEDATVATGLNITLFGIGACVGDYDNDGYQDLFISCVGGHHLFKNVDGKRFVDVTAKAGVAGPGVWPSGESAEAFLKHAPPIPFGTSATFIDYDGDGKLDLFVCHYCTWSPSIDLSIKSTLTGVGRTYQQPTALEGNQCSLYRNRGDGTFEDVSEVAGARVTEAEGTDAGAKKRPVGKSLGVILFDADGDGWPDLFVANDTVRNFFFHNVGDGKGGRKFVERGKESNVAYAIGGARGAMGIDVGEYRPGQFALLVANFANEENTFLVQQDAKRPLSFNDACAAVGMAGPSKGPLKFGTFFFDYDLDGRLDALTANGHIDPDIAKIPIESDLRAARATLLEFRSRRGRFRAGHRCGERARSFQTDRRPRQRLSRLRRRWRPRRRAHGQRRPAIASAERPENGSPLAAADPRRGRREEQPLRHRRRSGGRSGRSDFQKDHRRGAGLLEPERTDRNRRPRQDGNHRQSHGALARKRRAGSQTWSGIKCDSVYRLKQGDPTADRRSAEVIQSSSNWDDRP